MQGLKMVCSTHCILYSQYYLISLHPVVLACLFGQFVFGLRSVRRCVYEWLLQRCPKRLSPKICFADPKLLVLRSILSHGSMFLRTAVTVLCRQGNSPA